MAKEEKGYWFSTENGTHIHAEEGESKEQAMSKKFSSFRKGKKENKDFDKINAKRMGVKQPEEDIFDDDYRRSYGTPTFENETDENKLNEILEKARKLNDTEIEDAVLDRLDELKENKVSKTENEYMVDLNNELVKSDNTDEWFVEKIKEAFNQKTPDEKRNAIKRTLNARGIPLEKLVDYKYNKDLNKESVARRIFDKYFKSQELPTKNTNNLPF